MWAWVRMTKSIARTSNASASAFFWSLSCPWNIPQSTRKRSPAVSTRNELPVTSPAAPRNVSVASTVAAAATVPRVIAEPPGAPPDR